MVKCTRVCVCVCVCVCAAGFTLREQRMSDIFQAYWGGLLASGDPNKHAAMLAVPQWPVYDPKADVLMQLDDLPKLLTGYVDEQCAFWDQLHEEGNPWV